MDEEQKEAVEQKPVDGQTHASGAVYNAEKDKWIGYKPTKGVAPPWKPFDKKRKANRLTIRERKFLLVLSTTGNLSEAYRSAYKITHHADKKIEAARVHSQANVVLNRLRKKSPELVAQFMFEDITPEFVRGEMMKLYKNEGATVAERTRILELMGKMHAMFTDKNIQQTTIKDMNETLYKESDEDFPEQKDNRFGRQDITEDIFNDIPKA
jgi:hypothetical protein